MVKYANSDTFTLKALIVNIKLTAKNNGLILEDD